MYPPQTSLIPVAIALARFVETNGFKSFFETYPYWYMGVPFRYLTGPIVPTFLVVLHKIISETDLFNISIYIIVVTLVLSSFGWGALVYRLSRNRQLALISSVLILILPWKYLTSFALEETSFTLARSMLPFGLLAVEYFFASKTAKRKIMAIASMCLLLLINTSVLPILIVGIASLVMACSSQDGKVVNLSKYIKISLNIVLWSLILVSLWYTPKYWLVILQNPSIGGYSGLKVLFRIFDLLKASLPLILAIFAVHMRTKIKAKLSIFALIFTSTFLFLTFFRFIGDWDFWQDWTNWVFELEVGIAILISLALAKKMHYMALILVLIPLLSSYFVYQRLGRPALISKNKPGIVNALDKLSEFAGDERVFISGSGVFWANARSELRQVRGGVDKVATHPTWDKASYEFREGYDLKESEKWLGVLGIRYVLIHEDSSSEFYHDFKNVSKWSEIGIEVWRENGDVIYKIF